MTFLRKLSVWKTNDPLSEENDPILKGLSHLNKLKEIIQLNDILFHYSRYFPSHLYAFDMFQASLINIKGLWHSICLQVKNITF